MFLSVPSLLSCGLAASSVPFSCLIESVNMSPTDHQSQVIKGCPLGGSLKPEAYTNSFLGNTSDLQQGRERMQRWHLSVPPSLESLALGFFH